jgi:hypothetical protein
MVFDIEYLHDPIPYRLTAEDFLYTHTFAMRSFCTVEFMNDGFEFVDMAHAVVSTKSATLHLESSTHGCDGWSGAERIVMFYEVVINEVKANRSDQILTLLAKTSVRQGV